MKSLFSLAILTLISSQALVFSACAPDQEDRKVVENPSDETVTLSVSGMTCINCKRTLEIALMKKEGVSSVTANHLAPSDNMKVTYDPKKITVEKIKEAIREFKKFKVS